MRRLPHSLLRLRFHNRIFTLLLILLFFCICYSNTYSQYFGRNKVQYKQFDFNILKTKHFDIYFYPKEQEAAKQAAFLAERWYARFSRILNHTFNQRQPLIIYASQPHFRQTTTIPGIMGEGTGGVTEFLKRRIVIPMGASLAQTDHVIGHELVHAFQYDISMQDRSKFAIATSPLFRLPLWFIEGMAEYLSIGPTDSHTSMWMRDAWYRKRVPNIKKLNNSSKYFPYRYGQSLWAYITGTWGDKAVGTIMKSACQTGDYKTAFQKITDIPLEAISEKWIRSMEKAYKPLTQSTHVSIDSKHLVIKGDKDKKLNISPSLSPDGKSLIFLSTRDWFSVDMYLADAVKGTIKKRLTRTDVNPEFESLQFIKSSGSWNTQGDRFVFGAIKKGKPVLSFINIENGTITKEVMLKELEEILNPSWSPCGRYIAFSAMIGGFSDIFIYDLEKEALKQITNDPFADLSPAWSPDGQYIAFVSDRFTSDMSHFNPGNYQISLLETRSKKIKRVPGIPVANNTNPQWSSDSKSLYFISDLNGITNIYRIKLFQYKLYQITNLFTGISSITSLSPALSLSSKSSHLVYCTFEDGYYNIYSIDNPEKISGCEKIILFDDIKPSILPPRQKAEGNLSELLKNPLFGLPEEASFEINDYKPKLKLDYMTPPQIAIGVDSFGTYAGGGTALFWSDMMGYHNLVTMIQASGRLPDTAALIGYQNSQSRWNWGAIAQRIPYLMGGYALYFDEREEESVYVEEEYIYRQSNNQLTLFASYPFSQVKRIEFSTGYSYINFTREIRRNIYSLDGYLMDKEKEKLPSAQSLHLGSLSIAFVHDSSIPGATSPLIGQSYRLEYSPTIGSISLQTILADYRKYIVPISPFTVAFRFLHYGRYGKNSEDERLWPLFLGYETFIRGYNYQSFDSEELNEGEGYFDFDRLIGSRILVANFEIRFPVFRLLGLGRGYYGSYPLEFITFFDTGLAWDAEHKPWFSGGNRKPLSSAGIGLRTNLLGYMVLGLNLVKPFDRPNKGWYLQLSLWPGF